VKIKTKLKLNKTFVQQVICPNDIGLVPLNNVSSSFVIVKNVFGRGDSRKSSQPSSPTNISRQPPGFPMEICQR